MFSSSATMSRTRSLATAGALVGALGAAACADARPPAVADDEMLSITYLANEGFLLQVGESAVLVDALFGDGLSGYHAVPAAIRSELEAGEGRFRGVDCVLVTHAHADHFDARAVARFLTARPAQLISTREVIESVDGLLEQPVTPDLRWFRPSRGAVERTDCGSARVSLLSLHHGHLMIKNLGFIVELDGFRVLHVGDTEVRAEEIRRYELSNFDLDVALLPGWLLAEDSWRLVVEEISARQVVAMHLPRDDAPPSWFGVAGSLDGQIAEIRRRVPGAWIPTAPLMTKRFERAHRDDMPLQ